MKLHIPFAILASAALSFAQTDWVPIGSSGAVSSGSTISSGTTYSSGGNYSSGGTAGEWQSIGSGSMGTTGGTTYTSGSTSGYTTAAPMTSYQTTTRTVTQYGAHDHPNDFVAQGHWHGFEGYEHGHGAAYATGGQQSGQYGWGQLIEWELPYERGLEWNDGRAWRSGGTYTPGHARKDLQMAQLHPWERVEQTVVQQAAPAYIPPPAPAVEGPMCRGRGNWR